MKRTGVDWVRECAVFYHLPTFFKLELSNF